MIGSAVTTVVCWGAVAGIVAYHGLNVPGWRRRRSARKRMVGLAAAYPPGRRVVVRHVEPMADALARYERRAQEAGVGPWEAYSAAYRMERTWLDIRAVEVYRDQDWARRRTAR